MIEAIGVEKSFGSVRAVRGLSFRFQPGEVVGLLGPNGAGKSTTIRILVGFWPPDRGRVSINGHDSIRDSLAARACVGYLPDSAPIYPEMRTIDYLRHRARLQGLRGRAATHAVESSLDRCRLHDAGRRRVGELSKGYRQRVGLAAALLHDPPVLILDEPTSGLDPTQILQVRQLVRELAERRTMLISSHILSEVEQVCGRVMIMAAGRILADGSPADLVESHSGPARYRLEVLGAASAEDSPTHIPGVTRAARLQALPGRDAWSIEAAAGQGDLREALGRWAFERHLTVVELSRQRPSLEAVFHELIARGGNEEDSEVERSPMRSTGGPGPGEGVPA
jgi:ABC-2 type transport system ATP-binding protein